MTGGSLVRRDSSQPFDSESLIMKNLKVARQVVASTQVRLFALVLVPASSPHCSSQIMRFLDTHTPESFIDAP